MLQTQRVYVARRANNCDKHVAFNNLSRCGCLHTSKINKFLLHILLISSPFFALTQQIAEIFIAARLFSRQDLNDLEKAWTVASTLLGAQFQIRLLTTKLVFEKKTRKAGMRIRKRNKWNKYSRNVPSIVFSRLGLDSTAKNEKKTTKNLYISCKTGFYFLFLNIRLSFSLSSVRSLARCCLLTREWKIACV